MSPANLYWREPLWLLLTLLPLVLLALNSWWQQRAWQRLADAELVPWLKINSSHRRQRIALPLLIAGWLLLCIALAGPRSISWLPPEQRLDPAMLVVVLDLSASMNADDVPPSRHRYAQQQLTRWLAHQPEQLAVGLVVFAGHAFTLLPASSDSAVITHFSQSLTDIRLPTLGNNLPSALTLAREQLLSGHGDRRLLLLTDGDIEPTERAKAELILNKFASDRIQTLIIGIGDSRSVSVPDFANGLVMQRDRPVLSRLQSTWLQGLTSIPSTAYLHYPTARQQTLEQLLALSQPRIDAQDQQQVIWDEWFAIALLPGILLISVSVLVSSRSSVNLLVLVLALGLQATMDTPLYASDSLQSSFAEGVSCYQNKDFICARQAFTQAAWRAQHGAQRASAVFNLANSYFFLGEYDQAAVLYRDAELLGIDPRLTAINLNFATSMQAAMQRHIADIQKTLRRAQWRAAATGEPAPSMTNLLGSELDRLRLDDEGHEQRRYKPSTQHLQQQLNRLLGLAETSQITGTSRWVQTEAVLPQSTAAMMNRLFEMELEIMAPLAQPQKIEGKQPW